MNINELYFDPMNSISKKVHYFINAEIENLQSRSTPELYEEIQKLPLKRVGGVFRAFLTESVYKALTKEECGDLVGACSLSELNNYNAYLDNWILDNKNNVWGAAKVKKEISYITISSGIYRELIEKVVLSFNIKSEQKLRILEVLSSCMTCSYQGQALDMSMSIETFDDSQTEQEYLDLYVKKSSLQSGYLYGASTEIGGILANADAQTLNLVRKIGRKIGTGLHISNDLGDFAILAENTDFKGYQDHTADLRNGRLTLPIWYVLKHGTKDEKDIFLKHVNKDIEQVDRRAILEVLHSSGAYNYCKKLLRKYYNESKKLIDELPESEGKLRLKYSTIIIKNNKYLSGLKIS